MKVKFNRLLGLLEAHGFSSGRNTRAANSLTFIRPSIVNGLWESIIVEAQGKRCEAVYASVGVSVTTTVMYKVLGDVYFLAELGEDVERGWTIIDSDPKAVEWESQVAEIAPLRASEWALKTGPRILQDTESARQAVSRYMVLLGSADGLEVALCMLRNAMSPVVVEDAQRLSECPGASGAPGTELAYQVAYYTILHYSPDVESGRSYLGHNPATNSELMQRIHILADKLLLAFESSEV